MDLNPDQRAAGLPPGGRRVSLWEQEVPIEKTRVRTLRLGFGPQKEATAFSGVVAGSLGTPAGIRKKRTFSGVQVSVVAVLPAVNELCPEELIKAAALTEGPRGGGALRHGGVDGREPLCGIDLRPADTPEPLGAPDVSEATNAPSIRGATLTQHRVFDGLISPTSFSCGDTSHNILQRPWKKDGMLAAPQAMAPPLHDRNRGAFKDRRRNDCLQLSETVQAPRYLQSFRCDECRLCYHFGCLDPPLKKSPKQTGYGWICQECDTSSSKRSRRVAVSVVYRRAGVHCGRRVSPGLLGGDKPALAKATSLLLSPRALRRIDFSSKVTVSP
ncbi:PHD finger protein 14 [Liparis tanakae]|uniref:PHD finger protein 14 n=1 Tax=Liparis tanakae TaxID=230148 RepID=A0A4Z2FC90_9TELE|nr:PHD finger protein 14 [Liparis tanakae]